MSSAFARRIPFGIGVALSFFCFLFVQGCAIGEPDRNGAVFKIPVDSIEVARLVAQASVAECADGSVCPSEIAMLVGASEKTVGWCTGFMVLDDVLMTNGHCIPSDIRRAGASCRGRLWASFAENDSFSRQVIECDQVESVSFTEGETGTLDFALVRLGEPAMRGAYGLSAKGFDHRGTVEIPRVTPNRNSLDRMRGEVDVLGCQSDQTVFEGAKESKNSFVALPGCKIIKGNSGSPILIDGIVRGIIHSLTTAKYTSDVRPSAEHIALGSNMACIQTWWWGVESSASCFVPIKIGEGI